MDNSSGDSGTNIEISQRERELNFAFEHIEKLLDRRHTMTTFYVSVNTVILAILGILVQSVHIETRLLAMCVGLLLTAGFMTCWIWRSLLQQYKTLIGWWYSRLREIEDSIPNSFRLINQEYEDLYLRTKKIGMTQRELVLNWLLSSLYFIFLAGEIWYFVFIVPVD